jgi:glutathione peroxidase
MTRVFSFCFLSFVFLTAFGDEDIYHVAIKNIDGSTIDLPAYKGRKMLIVVLPGLEEDGKMTISKLTSFASKHSSLIVIGVPATEWGYSDTSKSQLKNLYKNLPDNFLLAEGMRVQKEGAAQSPIFQWLTDRNKNGLYDRDVPGVGEKFFIDEQGKLYGVLGASLQLDSPIMERILTKTRGTQK